MRDPQPDTIEILNINVPGTRTRVSAEKYRAMRKAILEALGATREGLLFKDLPEAARAHLPGGHLPGGGSVTWYCTAVKLDLEARGLIARVPGTKPQRVRAVAQET